MRSIQSLSKTFALCAAALAVFAGVFGEATEAEAQEIQLTGPLAGAPAVRKLRLHRDGRFEVTPNVSFTLLDEYNRTIMPGLRASYHFTDWFGAGIWGGYGFQYTTSLSDQLQEKAIDARNCDGNPNSQQCRLTAVNLTKGNLFDDQLARLQWIVAPEVTFVPFRGKLSLFSVLFVDTDVNFFVGPAIIGLQERGQCGPASDNPGVSCSSAAAFSSDQGGGLQSRVTATATFGAGLNFYPTKIFGFGAEFRGLPFALNTSGFDNFGGPPDGEFPDNSINGDDQQFRFNSMITVNFIFRFPDLEVSE
jgi:outer membrane beta-barrel protein